MIYCWVILKCYQFKFTRECFPFEEFCIYRHNEIYLTIFQKKSWASQMKFNIKLVVSNVSIYIIIYIIFCFPRLGAELELWLWCSCRPTPQPQQCGIQAVFVTYTRAHSNARSLAHWVRPGIEPVSSRVNSSSRKQCSNWRIS